MPSVSTFSSPLGYAYASVKRTTEKVRCWKLHFGGMGLYTHLVCLRVEIAFGLIWYRYEMVKQE